MNTDTLTLWAPRVLSILRIVAALIFMAHGTQKLLGFPPHPSPPAAMSLSWIAGLIELVGGPLLALGLFTRPVALLMASEMLFAFFQAHFPKGGSPLENGGELALLYMLVFLFFAANGAGPASLDSRRTR
jgi:putative oxidoreductase